MGHASAKKAADGQALFDKACCGGHRETARLFATRRLPERFLAGRRALGKAAAGHSPYHRQKWPNRTPGNVAPPKLGARVDRQNPYGYRMAILYINNGDFMAQRNRLTDQAIADIKAATSAQLEKVSFGWQVVLEKGGARIALEDKTDRPVVYTSKDAAKRSLERHNEDINISLKPRF